MKQPLKIVVLAKQVPDTRNVGKDAMTPEGTVNRAALPAIFNPEDLNALEMALNLKDRMPGATVHILTMGPQRAADIIRDAMFRGADASSPARIRCPPPTPSRARCARLVPTSSSPAVRPSTAIRPR